MHGLKHQITDLESTCSYVLQAKDICKFRIYTNLGYIHDPTYFGWAKHEKSAPDKH